MSNGVVVGIILTFFFSIMAAVFAYIAIALALYVRLEKERRR